MVGQLREMAPRDSSYTYRAVASGVVPAGEGEKKEMVIGDRVYDVTNFVKRHPGGKIITYQVGTDATDAYRQFHIRSKKADKVLASLPSRPLGKDYEPRRAELVADFERFTNELKAEGMFKPAPVHVAYRLAEIVLMHVAGAALIYHGFIFAGILMLGVVQGRCGWLMHEGGHYSLTGNIKLDRAIQVVCYGLGCGMSGAWWRNQHNKHHATPQKLKHDVDLDTLPLVAFHARCAVGGQGDRSARAHEERARAFALPQDRCQGPEPDHEGVDPHAGQALCARDHAPGRPRLAAVPPPAPHASHGAL